VTEIPASRAAEASRHLLIKGEEEERRRISRELHDETGQALMVLRFHLEMLAGEATSREQKAKVRESLDVLDRTIEGLRRIIARLSPRVLEELGLLAAISRQAQQLTRHMKIKTHLHLPEKIPPMEHDVQVALYRSVQEALHNVTKHSQARNCAVKLETARGRVLLQIKDDGVGLPGRLAPERGFGLTGMRERAVALGGSMTTHSRRGKGTQIQIILPSAPQSKQQATSNAGNVRRVTAPRAS
jgi:two-component system sensor histidine kinase UhpB